MHPREPAQQLIPIKKLVFYGDSQTGKSRLLECINEDKPITDHSYHATIGLDFKIFAINQISVQAWDTAGQERLWATNASHLWGANCIVIVYDLTNRNSFDNIPFWVEKSQSINNNCPIFLIGTKKDLISDRQITSDEGEAFVNSLPNCIGSAEVSSRENINVSQTFQKLINIIAKDELLEYQKQQLKAYDQRLMNRYNKLSDNQKKYVTQLELVWEEETKKLCDEQSHRKTENIHLTLIKSILDYYTKNDNTLSFLFSPCSWASHHISDVTLISNSIITGNPTPAEIIECLERLNPVATGDVKAIIYFLKEKFNFSADNEEKKALNNMCKF